MAKYDFYCTGCKSKSERSCLMAERDSQVCDRCSTSLQPLFSPPKVFVIPQAFKYAFSDLFGTSSEKDYLKANPDLVPTKEANVAERPKERLRRKAAQAAKDVADIERAIAANKTLVGDGGTKVDIVSQKTVKERLKEKANAKS